MATINDSHYWEQIAPIESAIRRRAESPYIRTGRVVNDVPEMLFWGAVYRSIAAATSGRQWPK